VEKPDLRVMSLDAVGGRLTAAAVKTEVAAPLESMCFVSQNRKL